MTVGLITDFGENDYFVGTLAIEKNVLLFYSIHTTGSDSIVVEFV